MFRSVMVANRGEIACRVMRTLRVLGIASVAVHTEADRLARHVREADAAVSLGSGSGYLDIELIIAAALASGVEALHPGYGYLAENADLADACAAAGICFVGPPPAAIRAMGDKIRAKQMASTAGVPVVPGCDGRGMTDAELAAAALEVGLPVLVKPSAGGGGKGMHVVRDPGELSAAIAAARRESQRAFADSTLLIERYFDRPRHIEVQVLVDGHGNAVHLGERECSLQRRHQKIVEEAPSPRLTATQREAMGRCALVVARACGYVNAGTVELLVPRDGDDFYFLEMNTRLQVEHAVTEMVYGIDLVELQLRVAAGERLPFEQVELAPRGHAIEARICAEDPAAGFLPTGGTIGLLREPTGPGVRIDTGLAVGDVVGTSFDPLLAKVIVHGADRAEALHRLDRALAATGVIGVGTNVRFLRDLLHDPSVVEGRLDTGLVERFAADLGAPSLPRIAVVAACLAELAQQPADDLWAGRTGWRLGGSAAIEHRVEIGSSTISVTTRWAGRCWTVAIEGGPPMLARLESDGADGRLELDGVTTPIVMLVDGDHTMVWMAGDSWDLVVEPVRRTASSADGRGAHGAVRSPMPGSVVSVLVAAGALLAAGDAVAVVEAMKMEHTIKAVVSGRVTTVHVQVGQQVKRDDPIVTIDAVQGEDP